MTDQVNPTTLTEVCGLPPDSLLEYLRNPSSFMSQPDNHNTLELAALREANEVLRDETLLVKSELARQDAAYLTLIRSLKNKAADPDTSAIRAAIYAEIAEQVEKTLNGEVYTGPSSTI